MDDERERRKHVEQEDVGRMMFQVERKQGEQKEKLRKGHERRRKGFPKKELQKLLGPSVPCSWCFGLFAFEEPEPQDMQSLTCWGHPRVRMVM